MSLPVSKAGMSSGSADLTKDLGGAVFQALLGTLLAIAYSRYFVNTFAELPKSTTETLSPDTLGQISSSFEEAELVADTLPATSAAQLITAAQQAFTDGKDVAIAVAFISVAIGLALVWFKYPRRNEEIKLFTEVHQSEP
jgi:hypothetical protein